MPIAQVYGYPERVIGEHGLCVMKEVSFAMPPAALRDIARFLEYAAGELEKGIEDMGWHRHIDDYISDWRQRFPSSDIVVCDFNDD